MSSPACFSNEHSVFHILVEALELSTQGVSNGGGEIGSRAESMEHLIAFLNSWGEFFSIEVNQLSHGSPTRRAVSSPAFLMTSLKTSISMSGELTVASLRRVARSSL